MTYSRLRDTIGARTPVPVRDMTWKELLLEAEHADNALAILAIDKAIAEADDQIENKREAFDVGFAWGYEVGARAAFDLAARIEGAADPAWEEDFDFDSPPDTEEYWDRWGGG